MISIKDAKIIRSLALKKYRQRYKKFIVEGEKISLEAMHDHKNYIEKIFTTTEFLQKHADILENFKDKMVVTSQSEIEKYSQFKTSNSSILIMNEIIYDESDYLLQNDINVLLDNIRDPGNMGTIIRTCDWFGLKTLILTENCVDPFNPKVIQSSMGSIFRIHILTKSDEELIQLFKDEKHRIYGTKLEGENLYDITFRFPLIIAIGNESNGLSSDLDKHITDTVTIKRFNSKTDSLNAAVSCSIILSEVVRQREKKD